MSQEFEAIYENGVLRPLTPLSLHEHEVVSLTVNQAADAVVEDSAIVRQREILLAFAAKMEAMEEELPQDGATNRDHDRLIYGENL